jgi:zinc transporter
MSPNVRKIKDQILHKLSADSSGLIWAFCCQKSAQVKALSLSEVSALTKEIELGSVDGFVWLHFNLSQASTERWLRENTQLPVEFFEALQQGSRSTRVELVDDSLLAVINDVLHEFSFNPHETSTLWLSVTPRIVISARRKPLKSVDRLRQSVEAGARMETSVELLTHLLRDQADVLIGIVRETVSRVDKIEDDLLADRPNYKRANLGNLRRVLVRLQRLMAPEPAALFRLLQRPPQWIDELDLQDLRQSSEEFSAVLVDMASLQERIKLLQEEIAAMVNERNSRSLYTLTVFTVMALPINMIAGLFGMNVAGIPLADHSHGFWMVVSLVACVTGFVFWALTRQRRDS